MKFNVNMYEYLHSELTYNIKNKTYLKLFIFDFHENVFKQT